MCSCLKTDGLLNVGDVFSKYGIWARAISYGNGKKEMTLESVRHGVHPMRETAPLPNTSQASRSLHTSCLTEVLLLKVLYRLSTCSSKHRTVSGNHTQSGHVGENNKTLISHASQCGEKGCRMW